MSAIAHDLPLFDYSRSRRSDPTTSHEAGARARQFIGAHHQAILGALRAAGRPMAAEEIADALGWDSHVKVNRRWPELLDAGAVARTTERHVNRSGRAAFRYRLVEQPGSSQAA